MREIISIHIGQAGIQVGNACWELFCLEHDIQPDGQRPSDDDTPRDDTFGTFFAEHGAGKCVPRSCFLDLEPSVVDEVRTGTYRQLFHPEQLISGGNDASNIYARGHYTAGKDIFQHSMNRIRRLTDNCCGLQGFLIFQSAAGGTGSGLGGLLLDQLCVDYGKKIKTVFPVYPSPKTATSVLEPYNALMSTHHTLENADVSPILDNEALYDICRRRLDVASPKNRDLNELIGQTVASATASMRFNGALNVDLSEFRTGLVPYPRIHFLMSGYSPMQSGEGNSNNFPMSTKELTQDVFEPRSLLIKCNPQNGKYMAATLMYRGDVVPRDVNAAIAALKRDTPHKVEFVDWSAGTNIKPGLNSQTPVPLPGGKMGRVPRSVLHLSNHTEVSAVFHRVTTSYDVLYSKRAFLHWYLSEGMEEEAFRDARENVAALQMDYMEVAGEPGTGGDDVDEY